MKQWLLLILAASSFFTAYGSEKDSLTNTLRDKQADTVRINVLNRLAALIVEDDSVLARTYTDKAIIMAERIQYPKGKIKGLYNLAYIKEVNFNYADAERYYRRGIQLSQQAGLPSLTAYGYQDYALVLKKQNQHKKALQVNDSALAIYTQMKDTAKMAVLYANMGNNYKNLNLFEKAISFHLKALDYALRHNKPAAAARAYNNIGLVYERMGNHQKALENFLAMADAALKSEDKKTLTVGYGNIGASYQNLKQHEKALRYLSMAREMNEKEGFLSEMLINITNIASAQNSLGRYEEALKTSEEVLQFSERLEDEESKGYGHLFKGEAYTGLKMYRQAETSLLKALSIAKDVESSPLAMLAEEDIAKLYQAEGNYSLAFIHLKQLGEMKDSVYNKDQHQQIATLQTQYETEQKDREIAQRSAAFSQSQLQLEKKNKLLLLTLLSAGCLALTIALIVRNMKLKQQRLQQETVLINARAVSQLQEEKLRISRELHDNIGSQLTFINTSLQGLYQSSGNNPVLKETQALTLNTIRDLRNTVWLINRQDCTIDEFVVKLHDYTKSLQSNGLSLRLNLNGNTDIKIKALTASHLFRIIQEAINNTIKYANASLLTLDFDIIATELKLNITDNGRGFDVQQLSSGFGIQNMKSRVSELSGHIDIHSIPGSGVNIDIVVPLV